VEDAVKSAVIESVKGTRREGVLREILGKGLAVGVAATLVFSYNDVWSYSTWRQTNALNNSTDMKAVVNCIYIVSSRIRGWLRCRLAALMKQTARDLSQLQHPLGGSHCFPKMQ
jgi:hypothetical protein